MNTNTVSSKEKSLIPAFFSFLRSFSGFFPLLLWSASHTRRCISGAVFQGEGRAVLYSLAVNTISTDGFQTVSAHAGSQWILGLFIVAELGTILLRSLIYSFSHFVPEPPSMMESVARSRWPFVPLSFLHLLPKYIWPRVWVCWESNDAAGAIKDGKLTALLPRFHSRPSKSDRRGIKKRKRGRAINGDVLNGKLKLGNPIRFGSKTKAKTMREAE